jgi:hypothetical protein
MLRREMGAWLRQRLTYANVVATLALFLALGGASYAAITLPRNSVGGNQLRNGAVTTQKLAFPLGMSADSDAGPVSVGTRYEVNCQDCSPPAPPPPEVHSLASVTLVLPRASQVLLVGSVGVAASGATGGPIGVSVGTQVDGGSPLTQTTVLNESDGYSARVPLQRSVQAPAGSSTFTLVASGEFAHAMTLNASEAQLVAIVLPTLSEPPIDQDTQHSTRQADGFPR